MNPCFLQSSATVMVCSTAHRNGWATEVKITARCSSPFGSLGTCNEKEDSVLVTMADYDKYLAGGLVQDVWPMMPAQDREIIMGSRAGYYLCSDCWHYLSQDTEYGRYDPKDITNAEYWEKKI